MKSPRLDPVSPRCPPDTSSHPLERPGAGNPPVPLQPWRPVGRGREGQGGAPGFPGSSPLRGQGWGFPARLQGTFKQTGSPLHSLHIWGVQASSPQFWVSLLSAQGEAPPEPGASGHHHPFRVLALTPTLGT